MSTQNTLSVSNKLVFIQTEEDITNGKWDIAFSGMCRKLLGFLSFGVFLHTYMCICTPEKDIKNHLSFQKKKNPQKVKRYLLKTEKRSTVRSM